jgi:predicted secreted protein
MAADEGSPRRTFLRTSARTLAALLAARAVGGPRRVLGAAPPPAPPAPDDDELPESVKKVYRARFGDRVVRPGRVQLDVPENAPDGRSVPVFVETSLPMVSTDYVTAIHIIVDHNPDIYLAGFRFSAAAGAASIDTRIKMRRTSYVRAVAETSRGELWSAATKVFVTLNGCG